MKLPHQSTPPPVDDLDSSNKTHAESAGGGGPATQITETGGPTTLDVAAIVDGEVLVRSGSTVTSQAAGTPGAHAATHQNGGGDEVSVAGLSGQLADNQIAGELATTGANVVVSTAAPPTTGQVLKATSATAASWQAESGGAHDLGGATHNADTLANLNSKVSDATLDGVDDPRPADEIITTSGPTTLSVGAITDGEVLVRSGTTITSQAAGTPSAHATSHEDGGGDELTVQNLGSGAAVAGKVLESDGAGGWSLIDTPTGGGGGGLAQGDHLYATLSANYTATLVIDDPVPFDTVGTSGGSLSIDANGRVSGLKAGRLYYVDAGIRASDGRISIGLYDVTGTTYLGTDALSTDLTPSQASLVYPFVPTVDSQVEVRITGFNVDSNDISQNGSFLSIVEAGTADYDTQSRLWSPPTSAHAEDEEFTSTTLDAAWTVTPTASASAIDPYANFTTGGPRLALHTDWRPSWLIVQPQLGGNWVSKAMTIPTNVLMWAELTYNLAASVPSNHHRVGIGFCATDTGTVDPNNRVVLWLSEADASVVAPQFDMEEGGVQTQNIGTGPTDTDRQGTALTYVALHKIGTTFHAWVGTAAGGWIYIGQRAYAGAALDRVYLDFYSDGVTGPGNTILGVNFLRFVESATFLP